MLEWIWLSYLMPKNCERSPGALSSDSLIRLLTWVIALTVAATNHGNPRREQIPIRKASTNRSRWYPCPFWNKRKNFFFYKKIIENRCKIVNWSYSCSRSRSTMPPILSNLSLRLGDTWEHTSDLWVLCWTDRLFCSSLQSTMPPSV